MIEVGFLGSAELDAGVDAVEGLGKGAFGGFDRVGAEEGGDFVTLFLGAEGADCGDDADAGVGGELGLDLTPVIADVVPSLLLGLALL